MISRRGPSVTKVFPLSWSLDRTRPNDACAPRFCSASLRYAVQWVRDESEPYVEVAGENTRAVLLAPRPLTRMDRPDRERAVYLHACLRYVSGERTTNASIRKRFGIPDSNSPQASRLLAETVEHDLIALYDPAAGKKNRQYVPFWAVNP